MLHILKRIQIGMYEKNAIFDNDKIYRYSLIRKWNENGNKIAWIMLNPSTADENIDDPTIRRCIGFSKIWEAGEIEIVNLFAYRSTNPKYLYTYDDPIGKENDSFILNSVIKADKVVIAWGAHGLLQKRSKYVMSDLLKDYHKKIFFLKKLKNGEPGHPLYVKYTQELNCYENGF